MTTLKKDPVIDEINFDGIRFWFRDIELGKIEPELQFHSPIPKKVMVEHKNRYINDMLNLGEV